MKLTERVKKNLGTAAFLMAGLGAGEGLVLLEYDSQPAAGALHAYP